MIRSLNIQGHCELDLWPTDPKIKRHYTSHDKSIYEIWKLVDESFQGNDREPFNIQGHCDLDLWHGDPKITNDQSTCEIEAIWSTDRQTERPTNISKTT